MMMMVMVMCVMNPIMVRRSCPGIVETSWVCYKVQAISCVVAGCIHWKAFTRGSTSHFCTKNLANNQVDQCCVHI